VKQHLVVNRRRFKSAGTWATGLASNSKFLVVDIDGDGKADLVEVTATGTVNVWLSTGSAFAGPVQWASGLGSPSQYRLFSAG
jgi:hypothetical protein